MKFYETLTGYIDILGCTAKELSLECGLSAAVISRYKNGDREPLIEGEQFYKLVSGIVRLAAKKNIPSVTEARVWNRLANSLDEDKYDSDEFVKRFHDLIAALDVNIKNLAQYMCFDASYLYRVYAGRRYPAEVEVFCEKVSSYICSEYSGDNMKDTVAMLVGKDVSQLCDPDSYKKVLISWMLKYEEERDAYIADFLRKLDDFNLDAYIAGINFEEVEVHFPELNANDNRVYIGVDNMRKGELDFFASTLLSSSMEPVFMCSDMPMTQLAADQEFNKKWMVGVAMTLKKGLHLNIIHNIDRPFEEMMMGLMVWIPIYMTGQISPYHIPYVNTSVYHHINYVSGAAALSGTGIEGFEQEGRYYLTKNKEEVGYFKKQAENILSFAKPLMQIYSDDRASEFKEFLKESSNVKTARRNLLSVPPLYTLSDKLLEKILARTTISDEKKEKVREHVALCRSLMEKILLSSNVSDEICRIAQQDSFKSKVCLSLAGLFLDEEIPYTLEEYEEHINLTRKYSETHPRYSVKFTTKNMFRNIQIRVLKNQYAIVSKEKTPTINFVINHPKMVSALLKFTPAEFDYKM